MRPPIRRHVEAFPNNDKGKTWYVIEYLKANGREVRRETIADGIDVRDAEILVKRGNQYFTLLEVVNQPNPWSPNV